MKTSSLLSKERSITTIKQLSEKINLLVYLSIQYLLQQSNNEYFNISCNTKNNTLEMIENVIKNEARKVWNLQN